MNKTLRYLSKINLIGCIFLCASGLQGKDAPVYLDESQPLEVRVDDLLSRLTFEEKIAIIHADSKFTTPGIPRLGIGKLWLSDGPHGVREDVGPYDWNPAGHTDDFATYLPVLSMLASTWNPELAWKHGDVIGAEALKRNKHVMLGPGLNMLRTPLNGRTFEYMGEDPWLTARMAVPVIKGIQRHNVAACAKHFALNNQEWHRHDVSVRVSDRALREIYLPAFEAAVKEAGVWTVMGAYNLYAGQYCCHNKRLLNEILKGEWEFEGVVVSDWNGTYDTAEAALNGLDLEMGTRVENYDDYYLAAPYAEGLKSGRYPMETLNDKARRNLRLMLQTKLIGERADGSLNTKAHQAVARQIAEEGMVLLKNRKDVLPLNREAVRHLAVIGEAAVEKFARGGGSSEVKAFYEKTGLEGLVGLVGDKVDLSFSTGYILDKMGSGGTADGAGILQGGETVRSGTDPEELIARAVGVAENADAAVVFATLSHLRKQGELEGEDRTDMRLNWKQNELISRVAAANPNTIVVLYCGSPVEMPWIDEVAGVLQAWYPGMEGGDVVASILFGDVNPSGKLPCTFPKYLKDTPAHYHADPRHYPGVKNDDDKYYNVYYDEGIYVGYRWYDRKDIEPLFSFGHGLSYTEFTYSDARVLQQNGQVIVECEIQNTGQRSGAEIVQVYVHAVKSSVDRPEQELKGFAKIRLDAGQKQTVSIPLDARAFAYYDEKRESWFGEAGDYILRIGASSRDIRLKLAYALPEDHLVE